MSESIGEVDLFEQALKDENAVHSEQLMPEEIAKETGGDNEKEAESDENALPEQESSKDDGSGAKTGLDNSTDSSSDDSSDSSSDDSSDSSSDSESDSVSDGKEEVEVEIEGEDEEPTASGPIRSVHEIAEEPVPALPEDFTIDEKATINEIGVIKSAFEGNIIISATLSGEQRVLKEGSILCLQDKTLVGPLCEVFGPLQAPLYRVTFDRNNEKSLQRFTDLKPKVGEKICYVVPEARWVDTFELKQIKGTDASNGFDEELPEHEQEFSDDEKEMEFKRKKKLAKKRKNDTVDPTDENKKASENYQSKSNHRDPIPSSSKTTVTYKPRNNRNNGYDNNGNNIPNKRQRNQRPHSEPPVPANPMQFPPNFPQMFNPQFPPPPMGYMGQQQFPNVGLYQPHLQNFQGHSAPQQQQQQFNMYPYPPQQFQQGFPQPMAFPPQHFQQGFPQQPPAFPNYPQASNNGQNQYPPNNNQGQQPGQYYNGNQ